MSPRTRDTDEELREEIFDTIARLENLARRLETFAEEHGDATDETAEA